MNRWILVALVLTAGAACTQEEDREVAQVVVLDKTPKPGRLFVYLGAQGQVMRVARYEDIPEDRRDAVMVIDEGVKRSVKGKGPQVTMGKPRITAEKDRKLHEEAAAAARRLLQRHPPAQAEAWEDQATAVELKKELEEIRREEEKSP